MWSDWIIGPALCFIGVLPLAVARAELWRLRTARQHAPETGPATTLWIALLAAGLGQFIAFAALTVESFGQGRAVVFELLGVAACMAFLQLLKGRASASPVWTIGLGFAAGLLAIILAAS